MKTNREKLSEVLEKRGYKNEDLINEIEQIYTKQQLALHNVVNTLLCDDNIEKMACEYTESESEYQAFILACQVISEKMQL